MKRTFTAAVAVGLIALSGQTLAATSAAQVTTVKGSVLVNDDGRYVSAASGAQIRPGDRLVALKDGQASITYGDGCKVSLTPGSMLTVSDASPCAAGSANRVVRAAESTGPSLHLGETGFWPLLLIAGGAAGGMAALASEDDNSTSP